MKQAEQEGRLSRWSRRKQQTAEETLKEDLALDLEQQELAEIKHQPALSEDQQPIETEQPVLCDADMEPVESLTEDSDFSKFMSPGVSDELRNLALRKMFRAPFFNIRDGLDEYDEDYTSFEKLGDIVTADMRHQMEVEANKKLEAEAKKIAELEAIPDQQAADSDVEQTSVIASEEESLEEVDAESVIGNSELAVDDLAIVNQDENKEIPHRLVEKMQQINE